MKTQNNIPALRFPEFVGEWEKMRLGKLIKIKSGNSPSSYVLNEKGIYPFIKVEELNNCLKYQNLSRFYSDEGKNLVEINSVIFPKRGAAILNNKVRINDCPILMDSNMMAITPNKNKLNHEFLYYKIFKEELFKIADTSTIPQINNKHIEPYLLSIPSLPEQQKIASFLSAVDEKIQQLTRKAALLEQYKKGIMQQLFSGTLRFKDDDGKDFPEWEEKKLGEVTVFLDGKRKPIKAQDRAKMKGVYPYYGASGIIDYVNSYIFDENIILLGEDGENIISRNLPLAFRVSGKCWVNNHAHVIKPINNNDIDFLTYSLERINYVIYNTGTAQPKLNQEVCRNITLSIPSIPEQQKIASFLSGIDGKIASVNGQLEKTQRFKKGLLQGMFV